MAKEIARVTIDDSLCNYLQKLNYELSGLKILSHQLISTGINDDKHYNKFLQEFKETQIEYNLVFDEICKMYTPDLLGENYSRMVNFLTGELVVTEGSEGGCNCGI